MRIKISEDNKYLLFKNYVYNEKVRQIPRKSKKIFFAIFCIPTVIAMLKGIFDLVTIPFVLLKVNAPHIIAELSTDPLFMFPFFLTLFCLCCYSVYFWIIKEFEDRSYIKGRIYIIDHLLRNDLSEYIEVEEEPEKPIDEFDNAFEDDFDDELDEISLDDKVEKRIRGKRCHARGLKRRL